MKTALVCGGTGFIGHHMAKRLRKEGYWVRVVDIEQYKFGDIDFADDIVYGDLKNAEFVESVLRLDYYEGRETPLNWSYMPQPFCEEKQFDEVYNFACLMGGAGFVFTGENDAEIMQSAKINLNLCEALKEFKGTVFYSSSACIYPEKLQRDELARTSLHEYGENGLKESFAYQGPPDSEYGWEKLFSERLYLAYARNYGLNVRIARFHNIYGPEGTYQGGKEKAPAAMCRKVITRYGDSIEVWGDGKQTRSFLYIDDCIDAVRLLMQSDFCEPINIGSEEMVSINELAELAISFSEKQLEIKHIESKALGVRGRNSDNTLIRKVLNWEPKYSLKQGLERTYFWIKSQYEK